MRVLRDALVRDDLSVGCASCRWQLQHGRGTAESAAYAHLPVEFPDPPGPVAMTFSLSNRCNLACAMCSPELSSTIRHRAGLPRLESPYDDRFFDDLRPMLSGLHVAKFMGGEPLLVSQHRRVWDLLEETGSNARLHVTTNGTVWNDRVERLLEDFVVDVNVSVDGATAATVESVRIGADFAALTRNIERFAAVCRRRGAELRLNFCLMGATATELPDVLAWGDRLGARVNVIVVTDAGFAMVDRPTDELTGVLDHWERAAPALAGGINADALAVATRQVAEIVADRRHGRRPSTGQAEIPLSGFLGSMVVGPPDPTGPAGLAEERRRLRSWASGSDVASIDVDADGTTVGLTAGHRRLGLDGSLVGQHLDDLVAAIAATDGRTAWAVEHDEPRPGVAVRAIVLAAARPVRGAAGTVVRFVLVRHATSGTLLVAEDRFYDDTAEPVVLIRR